MFELIVMIIILLPVGLYFIFIGWNIWKKEKITLIHDYHYTRAITSLYQLKLFFLYLSKDPLLSSFLSTYIKPYLFLSSAI